jgi:hypothetical protein
LSSQLNSDANGKLKKMILCPITSENNPDRVGMKIDLQVLCDNKRQRNNVENDVGTGELAKKIQLKASIIRINAES